MDKNAPLVSIILPVYNRRHLIQRAIDSVEAQTVRDWELLIIDDGSTDGLEADILPLIAARPSYRYFKQTRRGLAATRNIGIQAALGRYVTFLDSDDEYKKAHLQSRLEYFANHPEVDVIHGGVELVGPEETFYVQDALNPTNRIHILDCCIGATFFGKKEAFVNSSGFKQLPYSAESEFLPRISALFHVQKVNTPTYRYYTGLPDSICTLRQLEQNNK